MNRTNTTIFAAGRTATGSRRKIVPRGRRLSPRPWKPVALAALAVLACSSSAWAAAGETLIVDEDLGNSPFTVTGQDLYSEIAIGGTSTGLASLSGTTSELTATDRFVIGDYPLATGTFYLLGSPALPGQPAPGGTLNVGNSSSDGGYAEIGLGGYGTFNQSGGTANIFGDGTNSRGYLILARIAGSTGQYNLSGGTLNVDAALFVGANGSGTFHQTAGTANVGPLVLGNTTASSGVYTLDGGTLSLSDDTFIGDGGTGYLTQNGGTVNAHGNIVFVGSAAGSDGHLTLTGGTTTLGSLVVGRSGSGSLSLSGDASLSTSGNLVVGRTGAGQFTQSGGTLNTQSNALILGGTADGTGTYTLSGGEATVTGLTIGSVGTGAVTVSGGTLTDYGDTAILGRDAGSTGTLTVSGGSATTNSLTVGSEGTGQFNLSTGYAGVRNGVTVADLAGSTGTATLSGGTLTAASVKGGAGDAVLNFDGGTLAANFLSGAGFISGMDRVNVAGGGAIINTSGRDVGVANGLLHSDAAATPAIDGGLTKTGAGKLSLSAANDYTGLTSIQGGTLALIDDNSGISTSSGVAISAGAIFDISGKNSDTTIHGLTGAGNVYLGARTLTVNLANGVNNTLSGTITGTGGGLIKNGAGELDLTGTNTYTGGTTLDAGTLGISSGQSLGATSALLNFNGGTLKAVDDLSDAHNILLLNINPLAPATQTFDTAGHQFNLSGLLLSAGSADVQVTGDGALGLHGNNAFTGTVTAQPNTTVAINNAASLGSAGNTLTLGYSALRIDANTTLPQSVDLQPGFSTLNLHGHTLTQSATSTIGGDGLLFVSDEANNPGILNLIHANTYTGGTNINGGTVVVTNPTGSATGSGNLNILSGGTLAGTGIIAPDAGNNITLLTDGIIAPGQSPGTLTFALTGDSTLSLLDGMLDFDLGVGDADSDLIHFASLGDWLSGSGTTLALTLNAGFSYANTYTLFDNLQDAGGNFSFADITGLDALHTADVFYNPTQHSYQISFSQVPEPTSLALLGLGGVVLVSRKRRGCDSRRGGC